MKAASRLLCAAAWLVGVALVAPPALSASETSAEGTVTYLPVTESSTKLADGRTVVRFHNRGVVLASDPGSALHGSAQDCSGTLLIGQDGKPASGSGYCDGVDAAGDVWWLWWTDTSGGASKWGFLGGTGKFQGIEGGGTTQTIVMTDDGRQTIRWQGTWTTK